MADAATHSHADHHAPGFFTRWFMSTNHKDIGILYLVVSATLGIVAVAFTMYMRLELMYPGVQYMLVDGEPNGHIWNVLVTGTMPSVADTTRYRMPMSLWFVDMNQRVKNPGAS